MHAKVDLRVLELLSSRLCHDLISPIGAVNNGLELLEDEESGMAEDALELSIKSARKASDLLQAFRMAVGAAGSQASVRLADARNLATGVLEGGKVRLDWSTDQDTTPSPTGMPKLILNLIMLAAECLPRGGTVSVAIASAAGRTEAQVTASGQGARLPPEFLAAFAADADIAELNAKTVLGYFAARLAEALGGGLTPPKMAQNSVALGAFLPPPQS
jgi:histidine phosphotransferase ChpT